MKFWIFTGTNKVKFSWATHVIPLFQDVQSKLFPSINYHKLHCLLFGTVQFWSDLFGFMCFLYHANLPLNTTWHSAFWLSSTLLSSPLDILTNSCWWDVDSISQICLIKARRRRKQKHTTAGGHKKFSCCPFLGSQVFTPEAAKWINCNCWPLLTMT